MSKPWSAEFPVDEHLAAELIESQFPQFSPVRPKLFGAGWDNTAFLVNDAWVFRFPRRQVAVPLLQAETRVLPNIASRLPLRIPMPEFQGEPNEAYPWPFAGYGVLPGKSASTARLDESQRFEAAEALGHFLRALHSLPTNEMACLGASPDTWGRLEVTRRAARTRERLEALNRASLLANANELFVLLEAAEDPSPPWPKALVHGDLYAAHLLVDGSGRPCGVIDWGDVHLGHPGLDLALLFGFLPAQARARFEKAYGSTINGQTRQLARFKALENATALLTYAHDTGKEDLVREGCVALEYLRED